MRIIFAGTPDFSVPSLQVLVDSPHSIVGVYTQPDRPAGRGRKLVAGPVKELALRHGLPIFQPVSLKAADAQAEMAELRPDLMVVVAYGLILPQAILDVPRLGCVNLHASLLPRWRGAAPIQRAILAGDRETGVCLMQMEAGLDSGPVLAETRTPISERETGGSLHDRLSQLAAGLLAEHLADLEHNRLTASVQDPAGVTYASKLDKNEANIDWRRTATSLERQVRAFDPWPVAQTLFRNEVLRVWQAEVVAGSDAKPGTVVRAGKQGIEVACGTDGLRLLQVQLPGGKRLQAADFVNARQVEGEVLG